MKNYDPKNVVVTVDGTVLTGYAEGTFVTCEKEEDNYTTVVGADGTTTRARVNNNIGNITVTLKSTSPSNRFLSIRARRRSTMPVYVSDRNQDSRVLAGGSTGWVMKPAAVSRGSDVENVEYTLQVSDYIQFNL